MEDLLKCFGKLHFTKGLPFCMQSPNHFTLSKYISEGFTDYILKPFNKDQIKEKVKNINE